MNTEGRGYLLRVWFERWGRSGSEFRTRISCGVDSRDECFGAGVLMARSSGRGVGVRLLAWAGLKQVLAMRSQGGRGGVR